MIFFGFFLIFHLFYSISQNKRAVMKHAETKVKKILRQKLEQSIQLNVEPSLLHHPQATNR